MIIASSAKKELAIPMQVLQQQQPSSTNTSDTSTTANSDSTIQLAHEYCRQQDHKDIIHFIQRDSNTANDFVTKVFSRFSRNVDELMLINVHESCRPVQCEAFIHENTVFLTSPVKEQWNDGEFQACVTHLIELAEEKTGCEYLVIAIDKRHCTNNHNAMLRAFMYLGFQMIDPSVYGQEAGYILVGYEL
ncbi:hypothetical protein LRAMOSA07513 [Lichtheimia ramosa]|uniref:Ornithine decarboxylase antizyme n=1 Tax=Lichtheimia ramosa TaxID=688394 RepID=A0A077WD53_9FUNG|nr:hypothetical protein LRAMOSA07513 [Lichtheimia ramosa]